MSVFYSTDPSELRRQLGEQLTDKEVDEYIREELLDEFMDEAFGPTALLDFAEDNAPKTYEAARTALIEKQAQAIEDQRRYGND